MNPYFSTVNRIAGLGAEARAWIGTPFAAKAMVKGAGADCVGLVAGIYMATGFMKSFTPGLYALDEGVNAAESKLLAWFVGRLDFESVGAEVTRLSPGDAIIFRIGGRVEYHAGLMLANGDFIHVLPKRAAIISNLRESFYRRRITAIFRPLEVSA